LQVFLCSSAADYVTGSILKVDGGYMTGMELSFTSQKEKFLVAKGAGKM